MDKGGPGDDDLSDNSGKDIIYGEEGDDDIYHADFQNTGPDGSKDVIDCGPGNDETWINTSSDHDVVRDCETVHEG
jgi:hemolysin type calcium-binding protein